MNESNISKVGIIGAGQMGSGIAHVCAVAGLDVILNGERIFENDTPRGAAPDQDRIPVDLAEGTNHLLIKIVNYGGQCGFAFDMLDDESLDPPPAVDRILARAADLSGHEAAPVVGVLLISLVDVNPPGFDDLPAIPGCLGSRHLYVHLLVVHVLHFLPSRPCDLSLI